MNLPVSHLPDTRTDAAGAASPSVRVTERLHPAARGLEQLPPEAILGHLLEQQIDSLAALRAALSDIAAGSALMADAVRAGGRLVYAGAGSSALMAIADGMELNGTFGLSPDRIILLMAGGLPADARMPGDTEDDAGEGERAAAGVGEGDVVIAVTASGSTPYPLAVARTARSKGARIIGVANNRDAPLYAMCDVAVRLETPPELVAGSTRMGAGTAQKATLNLMSTLMGILLGEVHDGMMVGVIADNTKLRARATGMIVKIAGVAHDHAAECLNLAGGRVKPAVLIALGLPVKAADQMLAGTGGNLRAAMALSEKKTPESR